MWDDLRKRPGQPPSSMLHRQRRHRASEPSARRGGIDADEAAALPTSTATRCAADAVRATDVGDEVTAVVNRNINWTNICFVGCHVPSPHGDPTATIIRSRRSC